MAEPVTKYLLEAEVVENFPPGGRAVEEAPALAGDSLLSRGSNSKGASDQPGSTHRVDRFWR